MKKSRYLLVFLLLLSCICNNVKLVSAAAFTSALIRPSTHSIGQSPLPLLISVRTTTVATEDSLKITIPAAYTRSGTASDYTVSTALLPTGYQAWPGIGAATNVSGTEVTFPSGNLQAGITYAFYLTGGVTSNPSTVSSAESVWQLESLASGSQVDSASVTVPVESSSDVNVTATVPPLSSYFDVDLASNTSTVLSQQQTATYSLNYSSQYPTDLPVTLQVSWTQGTIAGSGTPSVDVAEYVATSATVGFGGAAPIIDPVARTITWEIPAIAAADGEQTVSFALITTSNYKGNENVSYTVSAAITDPAVSLPSEVTQTYKYAAPAATPKPSSSGSSSSTSTPTPTPTATPTATSVSASRVISVQLPTISDTSVEIEVELSEPASVRIVYGTDPADLNQSLNSPEITASHLLALQQLSSDTRYYFRLQATTAAGTTASSELYTFVTASQPLGGLDRIVTSISFQGLPLLSIYGKDQSPLIIFPENQQYSLIVQFPNETLFKNFRLTVMYDQLQTVGAAYQIPFINTGNNTYAANLIAQAPYGRYSVTYDIEDYFGNRQSLKVATMKVVRQMTVIDAQTKEPVENATISLERFNDQLQLYEEFDLQAVTKDDEWQSDQNGVITITLPQGKYRVSISAPSYKTSTKELEINEQIEEYSQIELEREQGFLLGRLKYFSLTLEKAGNSFSKVFLKLHGSRTLYIIAYIISMLLLCAGLVLSLAAKTHIPIYKLPSYLLTKLQSLHSSKVRNMYLQGKVINAETQSSISRADVAVMDEKQTVIATTQTASNGYFHIKLPDSPATLLVTEPGFLPNTYQLPQNPDKTTFLFTLSNKSNFAKAESKVSAIFKFITSSLFEFMLVFFCIAQYYFAQNFGWLTTLPFIIISLVNLVIWTVYLSTQMLPQQFTELHADKQH